MPKSFYIVVAVLVLLFSASSAHALSTYLTVQGGTGTSSPSGILYGDNGATNHVNTVTIGSNLTFSGGTLSATGGGAASAFDIATTSSIAIPDLAYFTKTSGKTTLGSIATTSVTCAGTVSCTSFTAIGSGAITITGSGGGGSGTVGTSTNETAGNLPYWTTTSGTPALLGKIATTTLGFSGPFNGYASIGTLVGGSNTTLTWTGLATTSALTSGHVLYNTTGGNGVAGVATTSIACSGNITCTGFTALGSASTIAFTGTLPISSGGTGTTTSAYGQLAYFGGADKYMGVGTTTFSSGNGLTGSGTFGALVGGTASSLAIDFTRANSWTGLQSFANASSSQLSVFQKAYFGGTATSTFDSAGALVLAGGLTTNITGSTQCLHVNSSGVVSGTASDCGSGGTSYWTLNGNNIYNNNNSGNGFVGIGSTTPYGILSVSSQVNSPSGPLIAAAAGNGSATSTVFSVSTSTAPSLGIGTSSPYTTLGVTGQITSNNIWATSTDATNYFGGNVGIGTTSPWSALTVATASSTIAAQEYKRVATTTTMTVDARDGNQQLFQIGTAATAFTLNTQTFLPGQTLRLVVCNPNASAGAVTWATSNPASALSWAGGTAPTQTTTANKCDLYSFVGTAATSTATGVSRIFGAGSLNF